MIKSDLYWPPQKNGQKEGVFKKHVIVKVREGSVKQIVKVFMKFTNKVMFLGFWFEIHKIVSKA